MLVTTPARSQPTVRQLLTYTSGFAYGMQYPPEAKVDQFESVDLMYQAVNSGRADAAATDQSSVKYLMVQNPGRYRSPAYAWSPQTYACAVKRGDQDWLNFVNTALHEAMTGVEFPTYKASFKQWFGVDLPEPAIGFPVEFK